MNRNRITEKSNISVNILAFRRPDYLYISLDSIFKMDGIEKCNVNIVVDIPEEDVGAPEDYYLNKVSEWENNVKKILNVISEFPYVNIIDFAKRQRGILRNVLRELENGYSNGEDYALCFDEDDIVKPTALKYLEDSIIKYPNVFAYNLYRHDKINDYKDMQEFSRFLHGYNSHGVMLPKSSYLQLKEWITNRLYSGLIWPNSNPSINLCEWDRLEIATHDAIFNALFRKNYLVSLLPESSFVASFGVLHSCVKYEDAPDYKQIAHDKIISGDRTTWLDNVCNLLSSGDYPKELDNQLFPRGFNYLE